VERLAARPTRRITAALGRFAAVSSAVVEERASLAAMTQAGVRVRAERLLTAGDAAQLPAHRVRILGKRLRYTVELGVIVLGPALPAREAAAALRVLQDALGGWHDHVVLGQLGLELLGEERLLASDATLGRRVLELLAGISGDAERDLARFAALYQRHRPALAALT
jgi:CHAD domain-containing protein